MNMYDIDFGTDTLSDVNACLRREWLETNGLGGFGSSTILGVNTRRYHGLLTAATDPPTGRVVLLSKLEETVLVNGKHHDLGANQYPGIMYPRGTLVDPQFQYDPAIPAGMKGGTMHPMYRKVRQKDIESLKLNKLRYINNNAIIGTFTNVYHWSHEERSMDV